MGEIVGLILLCESWINFWDPSFHLSNFEEILGSKKRYAHGTTDLNLGSTLA